MPRQVPQAAVLAIREGSICLITSTNGNRWVIPKGMIDPGHTAPEAAAIEAWEEAGLVGDVSPDPIGEFTYRKRGRRHLVAVHLMTVAEEKAEWPEADFRRREWVTVDEAIARVADRGLRDLLREHGDQLTATTAATG